VSYHAEASSKGLFTNVEECFVDENEKNAGANSSPSCYTIRPDLNLANETFPVNIFHSTFSRQRSGGEKNFFLSSSLSSYETAWIRCGSDGDDVRCANTGRIQMNVKCVTNFAWAERI
jgi:hypothetical protein